MIKVLYVQGLGFRGLWGLGFRGLGFVTVCGLGGFRVQCKPLRLEGSNKLGHPVYDGSCVA